MLNRVYFILNTDTFHFNMNIFHFKLGIFRSALVLLVTFQTFQIKPIGFFLSETVHFQKWKRDFANQARRIRCLNTQCLTNLKLPFFERIFKIEIHFRMCPKKK